jgi:hypothetical protein
MKKYWLCFLVFGVIYSGLQSQNKFSYRTDLPVYSITNDTLKSITDSVIIKQQNKKNIIVSYVHYYPNSTTYTYDIAFHLTEKSLLYDFHSLYEHPYCQQFIIEYKNHFIPAYLERCPRDYHPKDTSVIEIPFLHQTTKNLRVLMKTPPKGYYDTTYLGEGVLEKWLMMWSYRYEDGNFIDFESWKKVE